MPVDSAADSANADACPGAPVTQIYWYPREGNDIFEIQVDQPGEFGLGLSSGDWDGEACGLADGPTCNHLEQTLALQTVDTTAEVVIGESTWFKQERFDAWALYYGGASADTGGPRIWDACVGSGYPGCCTRDSSP